MARDTFVKRVKQLWLCERGAPSAEAIIGMALVGIPLIILLILFGKDAGESLQKQWTKLTGTEGAVWK